MGLVVTKITAGFDGAEMEFRVNGKIEGRISLSVDEIRKYTGRDGISREECAEVVRKSLLENLMTEEEKNRMMPEGYRWPRFENDEPVLIGDEVSFGDDGGAVSSIELQDEGYFLLHVCDGAGYFSQCHFSPGERVKRPPVIEEIEARMMPEGMKWPVVDGKKIDFKTAYDSLGVLEGICIYNNGACEVISHDGIKAYANELHITEPDSWERLEDDARKSTTEYWGCSNMVCVDCNIKNNMPPKLYYGVSYCRDAKSVDIAIRAKKLCEMEK